MQKMAEVRIIDYDAVQRERQEDKGVYEQMAIAIVSALGGGTSLSDQDFELEAPFRGYLIRQGQAPPLVSIESRIRDVKNKLSGLVVDVTVHQEAVFTKVKGPVMDASRKFRQVERVNLIEKYEQNG